MAFCVRSERNIEFNPKDNYPGPGQYIKLSPRIVLNNKRKFPPFFSSAKRSSFIKLNNIPGPGSYNLNKNFIQTSIHSNPQMLSTNSSNEREPILIQAKKIVIYPPFGKCLISLILQN